MVDRYLAFWKEAMRHVVFRTRTSTLLLRARAQGLDTGELAELISALRAGATYVNVHSNRWPGGEIRSSD